MEVEDINKNIIEKMWKFYKDNDIIQEGQEFKYKEDLFKRLE